MRRYLQKSRDEGAYKKFVSDHPDYDIEVKLCAFTSSEIAAAIKEFEKE